MFGFAAGTFEHPPGAWIGGIGVLSLVGACLTAALPDMVEQLVF